MQNGAVKFSSRCESLGLWYSTVLLLGKLLRCRKRARLCGRAGCSSSSGCRLLLAQLTQSSGGQHEVFGLCIAHSDIALLSVLVSSTAGSAWGGGCSARLAEIAGRLATESFSVGRWPWGGRLP